jgi:hypothetical protein
MKTIWMMVAAASLAACAGRGEDDMGAAPDRGDTTAVTTGADTTQWDTTDTGGVGQTAEPGMIPDTAETADEYPTEPAEEYPTTPAEEYPTTPSDTTMGEDPGMSADSTGMPGGYDTPVTPGVDTTGTTGWETDTSDTSGMSQDSALTDPTLPSADTTQTAQ